MRTLESVYWRGVALLGRDPLYASNETSSGGNILVEDQGCNIGQWDPYVALDVYGEGNLPSTHEALTAVADDIERCGHESVAGATKILIVPGYPFKVLVDF